MAEDDQMGAGDYGFATASSGRDHVESGARSGAEGSSSPGESSTARFTEPLAGATKVATRRRAPGFGALKPSGGGSAGSTVKVALTDAASRARSVRPCWRSVAEAPAALTSARVVCNPRGYVRWDGTLENRVFKPGWVVTV